MSCIQAYPGTGPLLWMVSLMVPSGPGSRQGFREQRSGNPVSHSPQATKVLMSVYFRICPPHTSFGNGTEKSPSSTTRPHCMKTENGNPKARITFLGRAFPLDTVMIQWNLPLNLETITELHPPSRPLLVIYRY